MSGAEPKLTVEHVEESGGHLHGPRPKGTFFRVEDRPDESDQKKGVERTELSLTTADDDTARVKVRYPGLVEVSHTGDAYALEGAGNSHCDVENYHAKCITKTTSTLTSAEPTTTGEMMRYIELAALLLLVPVGVNAQQVRKDPASGHYYVTVYDDDLEPREILVESASLVELMVAPAIQSVAGGFHYTYEVQVQSTSPQSLRTFQLRCPESDTAIWNLSAIAIDEGDELATRRGTWADQPTCFIPFGAIPLAPGERMRLQLESSLLPAIGETRGLGAVRGVSWPTTDPIPENDEARAFVRSIQGFTGGWKSVPSVIPARDPTTFANPPRGVREVKQDLARACGDLGWISQPGICRSLEAKLEQAGRSIERGQRQAARGQLEAFLQELEAQHGATSGKHVDDNAYSLLRTNVEFMLTRL